MTLIYGLCILLVVGDNFVRNGNIMDVRDFGDVENMKRQ